MAIKVIKPVTPAQRQMSVTSFKEITRSISEKRLTKKLQAASGRNNQGRITVAHRGGGAKRKYRLIDFNRTDRMNVQGVVKEIEYDPNRTCRIMLVAYKDGIKRYHIAPNKIKVGTHIIMGEKTKIIPGNRMPLKNIPIGFHIYNIELKPGNGGKIVRSAGSSASIIALEGKFALIELPSGEARQIPKECLATVGVVSNIDNSNIKIGKAGRARHKGHRPTVRGKAKNPCDHPHGGGEGGNPIGLKHPKTPWGMPALGLKTRKRKYSDCFIVRSRKRKKK